MSKTKTAVDERLPYLLSKLKAPRVLERLEQTAERAREEGWPYEQFLEALLEAEVFARNASGRASAFAVPPSRRTRRWKTSTSRRSRAPTSATPWSRPPSSTASYRAHIVTLTDKEPVVTVIDKSYRRLRARGTGPASVV